jgi:hypothetical protein
LYEAGGLTPEIHRNFRRALAPPFEFITSEGVTSRRWR